MTLEQQAAAAYARGLVVRQRRPRPAREPVQDAEHLVDARHRVRLGAPERRQAQAGESLLQWPQVDAAQREIVGEVASAGDAIGSDRLERGVQGGFPGQHVAADRGKAVDQVIAGRRIPGSGRA
jgi:hypothetical protein